MQLEFQYLSDVTGNTTYAEKALAIFEHLAAVPKQLPGLIGQLVYLGRNKINSHNHRYSLGAEADSYYEYLLKLWISTGLEKYRVMYDEAADVSTRGLVEV